MRNHPAFEFASARLVCSQCGETIELSGYTCNWSLTYQQHQALADRNQQNITNHTCSTKIQTQDGKHNED